MTRLKLGLRGVERAERAEKAKLERESKAREKERDSRPVSAPPSRRTSPPEGTGKGR
jgi:hypothetical protein